MRPAPPGGCPAAALYQRQLMQAAGSPGLVADPERLRPLWKTQLDLIRSWVLEWQWIAGHQSHPGCVVVRDDAAACNRQVCTRPECRPRFWTVGPGAPIAEAITVMDIPISLRLWPGEFRRVGAPPLDSACRSTTEAVRLIIEAERNLGSEAA